MCVCVRARVQACARACHLPKQFVLILKNSTHTLPSRKASVSNWLVCRLVSQSAPVQGWAHSFFSNCLVMHLCLQPAAISGFRHLSWCTLVHRQENFLKVGFLGQSRCYF